MIERKPLGHKAYGSIPHLQGSRRGPADKGVNPGQHRICCEKRRDKLDTVIVQEKLDGSNVAVAKVSGAIVPLVRAGYVAGSSPYRQHHIFASWVYEHQDWFHCLLSEGERICGEWLAQAHGTRYDLAGRSPFVAFDLMSGPVREPLDRVLLRIEENDSFLIDNPVEVPPLLWQGDSLSIAEALCICGENGRYGALDPVEGVVYRVERNGSVDFLAKYVRPEKVDGVYFPENYGGEVWNWEPRSQSQAVGVEGPPPSRGPNETE